MPEQERIDEELGVCVEKWVEQARFLECRRINAELLTE